MNSGFVRKCLTVKFNLTITGFSPTQWPGTVAPRYWGNSIIPFSVKSFWRPVSCDVTYNEFRRKFRKKYWEQEKKKEKPRRKVDRGNKRLKEKDHFWAVTSSLHYSMLIPYLVWPFMGFLSLVIILSLFPLCSLSYQHCAGVPWHSGKLNLIIKYSNPWYFFSTLCISPIPSRIFYFFVEQCHDCWGYRPVKNQFPPPCCVVWGSFHKLLWWIFTGKPLWIVFLK